MLATFLVGITIGSWFFEKWFRNKREVTAELLHLPNFATHSHAVFRVDLSGNSRGDAALLRNFGMEFHSLLTRQAVTCGLHCYR